MPKEKFGLYPLSADDLILSIPLFQTILRLLESGTEEERRALANRLRAMCGAPFA